MFGTLKISVAVSSRLETQAGFREKNVVLLTMHGLEQAAATMLWEEWKCLNPEIYDSMRVNAHWQPEPVQL